MAMFSIHHPWVLIFGILGNVISFMVFLAPLPTFIRIYKKRSTEGFQSLPYLVALFSCMLWIYYALLKSDAFLLVTINSVGCIIETFYIAVFITYAPKKIRVSTCKFLFLLNFGGFSAIALLSHFLAKGSNQAKVLGWICMAVAVSVFVAPLSIMRKVIRTKSVEFMPFYLSFFLTISAVMWLGYGVLLKDLFIALPNVLGFSFGMVQMILYMVYKKRSENNNAMEEEKVPEEIIVNVEKLSTVLTDNQTQESTGDSAVVANGQTVRCQTEYYREMKNINFEPMINPPSQLVKCEA